MDPTRFDAWTKQLATGSATRRRLVRWLGGTIAGGLLSEFGASRAGAANGDNSDCAHWCHSQFGGAAAGRCTSEAAHGTGPCYTDCTSPSSLGCTLPQTCGGGGIPGACGCTPTTMCPTGQICGSAPDGCGGTIDCGTCASGRSCNDGVCSCQACADCASEESCFSGVCRACQRTTITCQDGLSTTEVCCDGPDGVALMCCSEPMNEPGSVCDTQHCTVLCATKQQAACDFNDFADGFCPSSQPYLLGVACDLAGAATGFGNYEWGSVDC